MEHHKISKLLNDSTVSKFVTRKWIEVNDLSCGQYSVNKNRGFKTTMLRSNLRDYSNAYIVAKGSITVEGTINANKRNKMAAFKDSAPFRSCISKINNTFIDNAEDLDILMLMYNLLEYSDNYPMILGRLWNYYRDELNDDTNGNNVDDYRIDNSKTVTSESFEYKTKIIGSTSANNNTLDTEVAVPSKHLSNFWKSLNLTVINFEIELDLSWSKDCVISEISRTYEVAAKIWKI